MNEALLTTHLGSLPLLARGKVRDLYALGDDLLFVATDRISAFDHVLGSGIPDKGRILTQISAFWFTFLKDTVANHLIATDPSSIAALLEPFSESIFGEPLTAAHILGHPTFQNQIAGRSMVVRRARMFPVECVVRGYLSGSGWKDYRATGAVCGIQLPPGLRESDKLPEPIFTPAAKINTGGHDENISYAQVEGASSAPKPPPNSAASPWPSTPAPLPTPPPEASSSPTPSSNSASSKTQGQASPRPSSSPTRSSPPTPPATGPPPATPPVALSPASTSSTSATIWNPSDGTSRPPRPAFLRMSSPVPGRKYMEAFRLLTGHNELGGIAGLTGQLDRLKGQD